MAEKPDLEFECGVIADAGRGGSNISETATILGFSHPAVSRVYRGGRYEEKNIQSLAFL